MKNKKKLVYVYNEKLADNCRKKKLTGDPDFENLNQISYIDEIENLHIYNKKMKKDLRKIKEEILKETFYSNRKLPRIYQQTSKGKNDLLRVINKDQSFLSYLRNSEVSAPKPNSVQPTKRLEEGFESTRTSALKKKNQEIPFFGKSNTSMQFNKSTSSVKTKAHMKNLSIISPIGKEKSKTFFSPKKIKDLNSTFSFLKEFNESVTSRLNNSLCKTGLKYESKQDSKALSTKPKNRAATKEKFGANNNFLNIDYEKIYRKVEIKNKKISHMFDELNNYGPYYSKCNLCRIKNFDFINQMKPENAEKVLIQIKKEKLMQH